MTSSWIVSWFSHISWCSLNPKSYFFGTFLWLCNQIHSVEHVHCSKYLREHVCFFMPHPRGLIQLFLLKFGLKNNDIVQSSTQLPQNIYKNYEIYPMYTAKKNHHSSLKYFEQCSFSHRSMIPKFVTPTAPSSIDNSWRSTTLSTPKKLTSSTASLECLVGASRVRFGESGTPSTIIYRRWSSRRYELGYHAPVVSVKLSTQLNVHVVQREMTASNIFITWHWRHNERDGVSNLQRLDCLLTRLFRRRSKETWKLCVTGLCEGNPLVTSGFPS